MTMEAAVNPIEETVGENLEATVTPITTSMEAAVTQIKKTMESTIQNKVEGIMDQYEKLKRTTEKMEALLRAHAASGGPPPTEAQESRMDAVAATLFKQMEEIYDITVALEKAAELKETKLERALEQFGARFEALETKLDAVTAKLIMAECTRARRQPSSSGSAVGTRVGSSLGSGEYLMPEAMPDAVSP